MQAHVLAYCPLQERLEARQRAREVHGPRLRNVLARESEQLPRELCTALLRSDNLGSKLTRARITRSLEQ
jgi:hypothetical protein